MSEFLTRLANDVRRREAQTRVAMLQRVTGAGIAALVARLGKHETGVSCFYINKLADVDMTVLEEMAVDALAAGDLSTAHGGDVSADGRHRSHRRSRTAA